MTASYEQPAEVRTRVRFFDGQYLQDQDFVDEQHYQADRRHRHDRLLHTPGIAEGLTVTVEGTRLTVAPGTAIDGLGRVILLTSEPVAERAVALDAFLGRTVNVYLAYQEVGAEPQAGGDYGRWLERPSLEVVDVETPRDFAQPPVLVARLVLNARGLERIELDEVAYAGVRLPGPGGASTAPTLRTAPTGLVGLQGGLTVSGFLGVGTVSPSAPLHVTGATRLTGALTVEGDTTAQGSVAVPTGGLRFGARTRQMIDLWEDQYGIGIQGATQYFRTGRHFGWYRGGSHRDGALDPGDGDALMVLRDGNLGVGTATPENGEGWTRVAEVFGATNARLAVRTAQVDGRFAVHEAAYQNAQPGVMLGTRSNHATTVLTNNLPRLTVTAAGAVAVGATEGAQPLTVVGTFNSAKDPQSGLHNGGLVALKGNAPQLDFIDTDGGDWAIHVNSGRMLFIREPWDYQTLALDAAGRVGVGTEAPATRLHVVGDTTLAGSATVSGALSFGSAVRQMINLYDATFGIGVQASTQYFRTAGHFAWFRGGAHAGGTLDAGGGTPLMVLRDGHLGVGTAAPENGEGWGRVAEVNGVGSSRLAVRTANVDGRLAVHDGSYFGAPPGVLLGTRSAHAATVLTANVPRLVVSASGAVAVGTTAPYQPFTVQGVHGVAKDPESGMSSGGVLAIKSNAPQIDFIDTDNGHTDWAIHVNEGRMYFIQEPWSYARLVLSEQGRVGVGTHQPQAQLDVVGNFKVAGEARVLGELVVADDHGIQLWNRGATQYWNIYAEWGDAPDPDLFFNFSGNSSGGVTGWLEPSGSGWRNHSDARLKEDVVDVGPVLDRLVQLRPSWYRFVGAERDRAPHVGFVAQEVQALFPDLVTSKQGYLGLGYADFAVLAVGAVRELQQEVAELQLAVNGLLPDGTAPLAHRPVPPLPARMATGQAAGAAAGPATAKKAAKKVAKARKPSAAPTRKKAT